MPGSPNTEEIKAAGISGTLFVNEILTVRPGSTLEFLAAVAEQRKPLMAEYGHHATGLYEVTSNQHEVVMVWATDIPSNVRWHQNRDTTRGLCDEGEADDRIVEWERVSAEYVTGGDTHIMTPLPRTVYGPDDWEDATLERVARTDGGRGWDTVWSRSLIAARPMGTSVGTTDGARSPHEADRPHHSHAPARPPRLGRLRQLVVLGLVVLDDHHPGTRGGHRYDHHVGRGRGCGGVLLHARRRHRHDGGVHGCARHS